MAPVAMYAQYPGQLEEMTKVKAGVPLRALSFDYSDVRLLDGPFKRAMEVDQRWLKEADVDRFLLNFRLAAGLPANAKTLGGWEFYDCELRGHTTGHLLSALALMYASTGDGQYRDKGAKLVEGLAECQKASGKNGYLSAFPEYYIDRAIKEELVWAPFYTLHKLYAGLFDQYTLCGNQQALEVLEGMCDWAYNKLKPLSHAQLQGMLKSEFGGMPETFYNLYALTGNERYRQLGAMFYHDEILNPLAACRDSLAGIHVNTQIPKVIGEARCYETTGNPRSAAIADFFWKAVVNDHTYVTGGNSDKEVFSKPGILSDQLSENTTETCNTYNMLKLTRHLFTWDASPARADYYERALYNHILSSQNPETGGVTYYHTLHPGSCKKFHYPFSDNTCCVGTGYENHAKYGEAIYYKAPGNGGLYINLFIASELDWKENGLTVRQETNFPDEASTRISVTAAPEAGVRMPFLLRYPSWATDGVTVRVNGKKQRVKTAPGSYVTIDRAWKKGDVITMDMPMSLHIEYMPDTKKKGAIMYGPIVLAAELGATENPEQNAEVPVLSGDFRNLNRCIRPVEGKPLTFRTAGIGQPADVTLSPLFRNYNGHYTVYFDFIDK